MPLQLQAGWYNVAPVIINGLYIKLKKNITKEVPTIRNIQTKKVSKKKKSPIPYSKEYMQEKWGSSLIDYAEKKGLSKKEKKTSSKVKTTKQKVVKKDIKVSFGFFNYLITISVISIFFVGILSFERSRLSRKFPFLEQYINYFFETLENFKIFIIDLYN